MTGQEGQGNMRLGQEDWGTDDRAGGTGNMRLGQEDRGIDDRAGGTG
jgi:hypothetical protein